ncbi:MAG: hypothetical protein ACRD0G_07065 [Acidimicrobiales bacterium]
MQQWMAPDQMTSHVHSFDAHEGGTVRISLTYDVGLHENLPPGVPPADNELGWSMSIEKLARLVEVS